MKNSPRYHRNSVKKQLSPSKKFSFKIALTIDSARKVPPQQLSVEAPAGLSMPYHPVTSRLYGKGFTGKDPGTSLKIT